MLQSPCTRKTALFNANTIGTLHYRRMAEYRTAFNNKLLELLYVLQNTPEDLQAVQDSLDDILKAKDSFMLKLQAGKKPKEKATTGFIKRMMENYSQNMPSLQMLHDVSKEDAKKAKAACYESLKKIKDIFQAGLEFYKTGEGIPVKWGQVLSAMCLESQGFTVSEWKDLKFLLGIYVVV